MSNFSVRPKTNIFEKLGATLVRRKKIALASTLLFVILSGVIGGQVFARFDTGGKIRWQV
jgi:hypothetical protein